MTRYRAGIIGLGRIASSIDDEVAGLPGVLLPYSHAGCYRAVEEIDLIAGADPYQQQRDAFASRWANTSVYADFREMLAAERLDIVSIATSAKPRPELVIACAEAGIRLIFAEKPISFSLEQADAMIDACQRTGSILAIGCTRRWDASWNAVRDLIDAGTIGKVLQITAYGQAGISHNGSHLIDLVRYLAGGEISWVFGEAESDELAAGDADFMTNGYLAFENGVRAYIRTWPSGGAEWTFEVVGETGRLRSLADSGEIECFRVEAGVPVRVPLSLSHVPESPGVRAVRDFITCLETGKRPTCSGEDGRAALEVAIGLRESHRRGGSRIDLPLADRSLRIRSAETLAGDLPKALRKAAS